MVYEFIAETANKDLFQLHQTLVLIFSKCFFTVPGYLTKFSYKYVHNDAAKLDMSGQLNARRLNGSNQSQHCLISVIKREL